MQDAIMKGNGNSRYLKTVGEALSLYPTYEDFMQAMVAGIFPVDFNGINKDGWTQLGTHLNKANLLSDTVISTLGLSTGANSTPNDAFNVLANVGNVHVWRKTSVSESPYYELGPIESVDLLGSGHISQWSTVRSSDSVSVANDGKVSLSNPSTGEWIGYAAYGSTPTGNYNFTGKFIQVTGTHESDTTGTSNGSLPGTFLEGVYFIPSDAVISQTKKDSNVFKVQCNKAQKVVGYKAGTHITYLTSTNRNAYKPAGYKLGSKITGNIALTDRTNESSTIYWNYSDQVDVSDDWEVSLIAPNRVDFNATQSNAVNMAESLVGNFIMTTSSATAIKANTVYFIPDDASVAREMSGTKFVYTTAIQSVTGYPAIPAGTTIKYLGVLGDKIRMQIVSYIGTGTSGEATPCSITADFKFKTAEYLGSLRGGSLSPAVTYIDARDKVLSEAITTEFTAYSGFCLDDSQDSFGKKSEDGKTITWYSRYNNRQSNQLNEAGVKYYFRFFG